MKITAQNYRQSVTPAVLAKMSPTAREADSLFRTNWNTLSTDPELGDMLDTLIQSANDAATPQRKRVNYRPAGGPVKAPSFRSGVRELPKPKPAEKKEAAAKPARMSSPKKANSVKKTKSPIRTAAKKVVKKAKSVVKKLVAKPTKKATAPRRKIGKIGGRKPDVRKITSPKVKANNRKFANIQAGVLNEFYQAGKRNAPKPAVKSTYKAVSRKLGLGR